MSVWPVHLVAQVTPTDKEQTRDTAAVTVREEKNLDSPGIATLSPGDLFRIAVPLRTSIAVNLGVGQLDMTLAPKAKGKHSVEDLHLIALLGVAQASIAAGDKDVILHGVVPAFTPEQSGDYHPSDYSIHLGSGNITNIGTPDEQFIDTEALTNKLQELHVHLKAIAAAK